MSQQDLQPSPNSTGVERIKRTANNRLGAVFSALHSFWIQRQAAVDRNSLLGGSRKDAYSLIFFNHEPSTSIENDVTSSPDELLTAALQFNANGGKDFSRALERAQKVMTSYWSTQRYVLFLLTESDKIHADMHHRTPVVILFSDGEDNVKNKAVYDMCRSAVHQGYVDSHPSRYLLTEKLITRRPLSFHAVSFGKDSTSSSLRRMAQIALEVQYKAPHDPLLPAVAKISSSYTEALDTVNWSNTFIFVTNSDYF